MHRSVFSALIVALSVLPRVHAAEDAQQSATVASGQNLEGGIELMDLLERSAGRLNKRFIVDPRLRGQALMVNIDPQRLSYRELQAILSVHGFVTTPEMAGTVRIVPDSNARQLPMPLLADDSTNIAEEEMVTRMLDVAPLDATTLIPLLRPLLPQYAHLVGYPHTNTIIIVARYNNVRMIESLIRDLRTRPVVARKDDAAPK